MFHSNCLVHRGQTAFGGAAIAHAAKRMIVAAAVIPLLAQQKRRLSALTARAALRADAAESALCSYLSIIALAGLVANAAWGVTWADPLAALCLVPLVAREGWQTLKGKPCDCC